MSFGLTSANLPDKIKRLLAPADRKSLGKAGITAEEALRKAEVKEEKDLQRVIEGYLNIKGITPLRARMDRKTTNKLGTPDFLFSVKTQIRRVPWPQAYPCAWEVKMSGKTLEPEQRKMAARLIDDGWRWSLITSLDEAIAELKTMGIE